jgi:hypothetical protein
MGLELDAVNTDLDRKDWDTEEFLPQSHPLPRSSSEAFFGKKFLFNAPQFIQIKVDCEPSFPQKHPILNFIFGVFFTSSH